MYSASRFKKPYIPVRAVKIPCLDGGGIGPRTESCVIWDGPIAMLPCLHQGSVYTKRKLRVWRDQKCSPLVGAKTILTCAGRQNTPSRMRRYSTQNRSCVICDGPIAMVPCLHQGNIYTKGKLRVWRDQKCSPLVGAKTILTCAGRQNTPSRMRRYSTQNRSCVICDGPIAMVPCLHQGNIYAKRKLRVWTEQICIQQVGATPPLTSSGR